MIDVRGSVGQKRFDKLRRRFEIRMFIFLHNINRHFLARGTRSRARIAGIPSDRTR